MDGIDWQAMFFGDEPPVFLLEILIRTLIIYAYTLVLLRWLGGRAVGQLSTVEFLLVIALGSAVGDAMFYPDVPLLHAMLVITLVVVLNKAIDLFIARSRAAQHAFDGKPEEAVRDGAVCRSFVDSATFSTVELFQELREKGVRHLGQVEHAFMENDGVLTVFKYDKVERPGLPIVPPWEIKHPEKVARPSTTDTLACMRCGTLSDEPAEPRCSHCGHDEFTRPVGGEKA